MYNINNRGLFNLFTCRSGVRKMPQALDPNLKFLPVEYARQGSHTAITLATRLFVYFWCKQTRLSTCGDRLRNSLVVKGLQLN